MKKIVAVLALFFAVVAIYAPAAWNKFVWDDTALVLRDPLIRSWRLIPEGFNHFLFVDATASDFYRPIQRLIYTADYAAFAFHPAAYHLTSIFFHAMAAIALFFFSEKLLALFDLDVARRRMVALGASLVWVIHPVHTSAVVYVSGLADPLAAAFGFAACYFLLRSIRSDRVAAAGWIAGSTALFLLSAFSKESGFLFLAIAFALLITTRNWQTLWKIGLGAVFIAAVYCPLRFGAQHIEPPPSPPSTLAVRPITAARAVAEYAGLLTFPLHLHMERKLDVRGPGFANLQAGAWRELQTVFGSALIVLLLLWAFRARKRNLLVFALLICEAIAYFPVSGVLRLNADAAEHWLYLPSAFLFLAIALSMLDLAERKNWPQSLRIAGTIAFAIWCLFLAGRTFSRTFDWRDQRTFLERTIAHGGDSVRMLTNLGGLELSEGHFDAAKKYLRSALEKDPDEPFAVINLSTVALKEGDYKTARELLERAKTMPEVEARAYENLAVMENKENGRANVRMMHLASRTGPPDWSIEKRYILLLDEMGATAAAMKEIDHVLTTEWYRAETWELLGKLLQKSGRSSEGSVALNRAHAFDVHLDDN